MSQETQEWLNTMTLIGFTEKRGNAWHYQEAMQGDEPNHYAGAIPVEDVVRRLFSWEPVSEPVFVKRNGLFVAIPKRQAISASDNGDVLGLFKDGYQGHGYKPWLVDGIARLLDSELGIGSAGLLAERARAWVQVEMPENVETREGITFRPHLLAATSLDGSMSTTYRASSTVVVCDNTLSLALGERGNTFKVKHTRFSNLRIADAREALGIVYTMADDFAAEVARLTQWKVTPAQWSKHLDFMVPLTDARGLPLEGRSKTMADNKRGALVTLYTSDHRVEPWKDTAFGVVQAYNTYAHHVQTVRGASRVQRNRDNAVTGKQAASDANVLAALATVTA